MTGFEDVKAILSDQKLWIAVAIIDKLHLGDDLSYLKVECIVMPEQRRIMTTMTWEAVGPGSGDFTFPVAGDLCLVGFAEGDANEAYVLKRLTSRADPIPKPAIAGDKVSKTLAGKKYWNISDTNIYLSRGDTAPTQNLVLGQVFKTYASSFLAETKNHATLDAAHRHMDVFGYLTDVPNNADDFTARATAYQALKTSPIDDALILSDLSFTEK